MSLFQGLLPTGRSWYSAGRFLVQKNTSSSKSIDEAVDIARRADAKELVIGGGAAVYERALPMTDIIYHSLVDIDVEGDIKLPPIGPDFVETWSRHFEGAPAYTYRTLVRDGLRLGAVDDLYGLIAPSA